MRAVVIESGGGPEVLRPAEVEKPVIRRDDEVLIRVRAAGINPIDTKIRTAPERYPVPLPAVLGCDGAGVVEAVGPAVRDFAPGDEVYYCRVGFHGHQGNYAEYAVVEEHFISRKPTSLGFAEAAAAPLVLITAWEALHDRVHIRPGQTILVHAGAGGVGHAAIQLAKHAGARVCTTVSTDEKAEFVTGLGAERVIRYRDENVHEAVMDWTDGRGVDIVLDTLGGKVLEDSYALTAVYGDVVTILQPDAGTDWSKVRMRNLRLNFEVMLCPTLLGLEDAQHHQGGILRQCAELFDNRELAIQVGRIFPLEEAAAAHHCLEQEHPAGKVVLTM